MTDSKFQESNQPSLWKSMGIEDFTQLASTPVPKPLMGGLAIIIGVIVYGLLLLHKDQSAFRIWIREDGLVEWLTFAELLMTSVYSIIIFCLLNQFDGGKPARKVWLFLGVLFFFGAMEEISWGQRIFGIQSPEWFLWHNRQSELNIHNLILYGVNINRLIFGKILAMIVGVYLLLVPLLYRLSKRWKNLLNRWRIPVAQNYQILLMIIVTIVIRMHLGLSKKVDELLELSSCYIIFLILTHPYNRDIIPLKNGIALIQKAYFGNGKGKRS
jgi:hypothetical protein